MANSDYDNSTMVLNKNVDVEIWGDVQVYVNLYMDNNNATMAYSFEYGDLVITVKAPEKLDKEEIKAMVTNAVWS